MSSKRTSKLNLHAWEATDAFRRDEFNENFEAIDKNAETTWAEVMKKADAQDVAALKSTVQGKADAQDVAALKNAVQAKADKDAVSSLQSALEGKAEGYHTHTKSEITDFPSAMTPTSHAASGTTYGAGSSSNYGHLKLSDSTSSTSSTTSGTAATPKAVKAAYDLANTANTTANTANTTANAAARINVGSYVGKGTFGQANPTKITLPFTPKILILTNRSMAGFNEPTCPFTLLFWNTTKIFFTSEYVNNNVSYSGNTISWYHTNTYYGAKEQFNDSSTTYYYIAIG